MPDTLQTEHDDWTKGLRAIGDERGFFRQLGDETSALFVENGKTLVITFENMDMVFKSDERMPWGYDFILSQGWSIMGMMAHGWTWYRDGEVDAFFDELAETGFFDQFDKVVFYGASMGGYGAAAFSRACPGATVIAISPQATLDRDVASWETRYHKVWRRDFSGKYGYAPDSLASAERVFLFYDPLEPLDSMHMALFRGANITKFKCRFQGHRIASGLMKMGLLKKVIGGCVTGDLTRHSFYAMLRARRGERSYQRKLLESIDADKHPRLIAILCAHVLSRGNGPKFRKALKSANATLLKRGFDPLEPTKRD